MQSCGQPLTIPPNASEFQAWRVKTKTNSPGECYFFCSLTDSSSLDPELFFDLASENFVLKSPVWRVSGKTCSHPC
jgi:hypothetical protein